MSAPVTYDDVKALAAELGRPASTLIALSANNDPFYVAPARQILAQWFADEIWPLLDPEADSVHIRRAHYLIVSTAPDRRPTKPDGTPYENTFDDWRTLCNASLAAREQGLVESDRFVDRRAGDPTYIFVPDDEAAEAQVDVTGDTVERPSPEQAPSYMPRHYGFPRLPNLTVFPPEIVENYVIEIWCEKSTMNDVLEPLARRLGVTLVTGLGELSHTHCNMLVNRALTHGRRTRILYISDFDPAGDGMPVSIARKVEHILRRDGHDLDIRLDPLLLTARQVRHYDLPRIPIKDSDARKGHFEARYGEGAVELDALEAIRPGELARLIRERVEVYRAPTRDAREEIAEAALELERHASEVREDILDRHADAISQLRSEFDRMMRETIRPNQEALAALVAEYEPRMAEHIDAINAAVTTFYDQAEPVIADIATDLEDDKPDPDDVEWPEGYEADESGHQLFQSERGYVAQIGFYKAHQGKPTSRRGRHRNGGPENGGGAS